MYNVTLSQNHVTFPSMPIPQSAAWIILTSFPPSPEQRERIKQGAIKHLYHTQNLLIKQMG